MSNPKKSQTLHIETLNDELSIYDWQRLQMHSLNPTASAVFEMCDGETSPAQMAKRLEAPEAVVWQSLDELGNAHLLSEAPEKPAQYQGMTRQQFLKLGGAVALASIVSIVVPRPAAAQTGGAGGGGGAAAAIVMYQEGPYRQGNLDVLGGTPGNGRTGADNLCAASANAPAGYANYRAFISVNAADEIRDMPANYGVPVAGTITGPTGTLIANDWADLLDGNIINALDAAGVLPAGFAFGWRTGSNADGSLHANNCNGWTTQVGGNNGRGGSAIQTNATWLNELDHECSFSRPVVCIAY